MILARSGFNYLVVLSVLITHEIFRFFLLHCYVNKPPNIQWRNTSVSVYAYGKSALYIRLPLQRWNIQLPIQITSSIMILQTVKRETIKLAVG